MTAKTLEEYFTEAYDKGIIDFSIRVSVLGDKTPVFYIHPDGKDGDTMDFEVTGNTLKKRLEPLTG